jgi:hypothetical protein
VVSEVNSEMNEESKRFKKKNSTSQTDRYNKVETKDQSNSSKKLGAKKNDLSSVLSSEGEVTKSFGVNLDGFKHSSFNSQVP